MSKQDEWRELAGKMARKIERRRRIGKPPETVDAFLAELQDVFEEAQYDEDPRQVLLDAFEDDEEPREEGRDG